MPCPFEAWRCRHLPSPSCTAAISTQHFAAGRPAPQTWHPRTSSTPSSSRESPLRCLSDVQQPIRLWTMNFILLVQRQRRCRGTHWQSAGPGQVRTSGNPKASLPYLQLSGWNFCHHGSGNQFLAFYFRRKTEFYLHPNALWSRVTASISPTRVRLSDNSSRAGRFHSQTLGLR